MWFFVFWCAILCFSVVWCVWFCVFCCNFMCEILFFPTIQSSKCHVFATIVYYFLTNSLKNFINFFFWLFFDRWIILLVIISTTLFLIIYGLGIHLFCIHHHLWYNINKDKQNFLLFFLFWHHIWIQCYIFSPLQDSSRSSDIAFDYYRCIIVKIVFQLHKPHYKEMWCSVNFCA